MSDDTERSVASDGSVATPVAWAVVWEGDELFDRTTVSFTEEAARRHVEICPSLRGKVVTLYFRPRPVLLPPVPDDFDISEGNGYAAAIVDFKRALSEAGVEWTE